MEARYERVQIMMRAELATWQEQVTGSGEVPAPHTAPASGGAEPGVMMRQHIPSTNRTRIRPEPICRRDVGLEIWWRSIERHCRRQQIETAWRWYALLVGQGQTAFGDTGIGPTRPGYPE